jgi:NADH-quinone oxidoreductase subunit E
MPLHAIQALRCRKAIQIVTDNQKTLTLEELEKLKEIFSRHSIDRDELIPILQETQEAFHYLPASVIKEIALHLNMTESTIYGVSTFYAQFKLTPQGKKIIRVCWGTACHVRGGIRVRAELEKVLGIKTGETTPNGEYTLQSVACMGACALAPAVMIDGEVYAKMDTKKVRELLGNGTEV